MYLALSSVTYFQQLFIMIISGNARDWRESKGQLTEAFCEVFFSMISVVFLNGDVSIFAKSNFIHHDRKLKQKYFLKLNLTFQGINQKLV